VIAPASSLTRSRHRGERGLTLIELIVSMALTAVLAGAIAAVFAIGLRLLGPGGPTDRLSGAHDLMVFEQTLGKDGSRAACVQVGATKKGSCANGYIQVSGCANYSTLACFGWPQVSDSTCHVAKYTTSGPDSSHLAVTRTEFSVAGVVASQVSLVHLTTTKDTVKVTATFGPISGPWTPPLSVAITPTTNGLTSEPTTTLTLHPVASDPAGSASQITSGGSPC
jgi:prepilin-type N-terminal cleavage/methylation domain-containing protein